MEGTVPRILKTFFIASTGISQLLFSVPSLNKGMRAYGARANLSDQAAEGDKTSAEKPTPAKETTWQKVVKVLSGLRVPHSWFTGFYIWSSVCSAVWGHQLYTRGPLFQLIAKHTDYAGKSSMSFNQIALVWGLFQFQGLRRLYESFAFSKQSNSQMNIAIFSIGIFYYAAMSVSMWIEGVPALMSTSNPLGDASFSAPSIRSMIGIPLFILASGIQYDVHHYLWSLKKYTFPTHPAFSKVLNPHYLAEVLIYVALTILGAPEGQVVNKSLLFGTFFVLGNLAVEADNSRTWYKQKFGEDKVQGKNRIIPYLW